MYLALDHLLKLVVLFLWERNFKRDGHIVIARLRLVGHEKESEWLAQDDVGDPE